MCLYVSKSSKKKKKKNHLEASRQEVLKLKLVIVLEYITYIFSILTMNTISFVIGSLWL